MKILSKIAIRGLGVLALSHLPEISATIDDLSSEIQYDSHRVLDLCEDEPKKLTTREISGVTVPEEVVVFECKIINDPNGPSSVAFTAENTGLVVINTDFTGKADNKVISHEFVHATDCAASTAPDFVIEGVADFESDAQTPMYLFARFWTQWLQSQTKLDLKELVLNCEYAQSVDFESALFETIDSLNLSLNEKRRLELFMSQFEKMDLNEIMKQTYFFYENNPELRQEIDDFLSAQNDENKALFRKFLSQFQELVVKTNDKYTGPYLLDRERKKLGWLFAGLAMIFPFLRRRS